MEGLPKKEKISNVDFLNEKLSIKFRFEEEAVGFLPEVTADDLESRIEKYRILLGRVEQVGDSVRITVTGILEMQNEPIFYREEKEAVSGVNIPAIERFIQKYNDAYPGILNGTLVGDVHTHPVFTKDFENGLDPWTPSSGDIESIVADYERGALSNEKPFIFGIAGPADDGETQYAFYRLIKNDDNYEVREVELDIE